MRFRLAIIAAAALSLAGCSTFGAAVDAAPIVANVVAHGPVTYADRTTLDETAGRSVELAYKAARLVVETGVDAGIIHGANAAKAQDLNRKAYAAVQTARAAYRSANADSISKAVREANAAIAQLLALAPGGN